MYAWMSACLLRNGNCHPGVRRHHSGCNYLFMNTCRRLWHCVGDRRVAMIVLLLGALVGRLFISLRCQLMGGGVDMYVCRLSAHARHCSVQMSRADDFFSRCLFVLIKAMQLVAYILFGRLATSDCYQAIKSPKIFI